MESWRASTASRWLFSLQWGHDLAVMERPQDGVHVNLQVLLQWGHDLAVMESQQ